ncbi:MAG TPA: hypothetical protein VFK33_06825 [Bacillales bacterium]|nr:hypothetical protein [Bacillales bacterium]
MESEQQNKKTKLLFFSIAMNMFLGLILYVLMYFFESMSITSNGLLNGIIFVICFAVIITIVDKLDPYSKIRKPKRWITRLIAVGTWALLILCFGY